MAPDPDNLKSKPPRQPTSAAASHTTEVLTTTVEVAQGRVCPAARRSGSAAVRTNQPVLPATWPGPARLSWQASTLRADSVDSDAGQPGNLTNPRAQNGA